MTPTTKTYDYIQDPGHGWLKVPLGDLPDGFRPTQYSLRDTRFAYLEEDCDFGAFAKLVPPFEVREVMVARFGRNKRRFPCCEGTTFHSSGCTSVR